MEDLITQMLTGLDSAYNTIVVQLADKENLTWEQLQLALMPCERRLEQINSFNNLNLGQPNINLVTGKSDNCSVSNNQDTNKANWRGSTGSRGGRTGSRGGRGRFGRGNNRPTCQICGKIGHIALNCYFLFDQSYCGSASNAGGSGSGSGSGSHSTFLTVDNPVNSNSNQSWFLDSGASQHISNDPSIDQVAEENYGKQKLIVGNGQEVKVQRVGNLSLSCNNKPPLKLNNVLFAPQITKNLLSVSRLAYDNGLTVEFNKDYCVVKDKLTGTKVLEGTQKEGLYVVMCSKPSCNMVERKSANKESF